MALGLPLPVQAAFEEGGIYMAIWVSQFNMPIKLELMKFSLPDDVWLLPLSKHFMGSSESPYGVVTTTVRPSVLIYRHRSIS